MKRNGFTLAELLIVLGITGVIAAVILPAINGLMPDKTKINYLKVYDELGKNIKALTADSTIFPIMLQYGDDDIDVSNIPLLNNTKPLKSPYNDDKYSGDKKLCNLIAFSVGVNDSCKETSYPETPSFTTSNGMQWWIRQTKREINTTESKASYQTDIYVDVDSSKKSSDCMYGEENCKNPDRFKFLLAADGTLVPADPVGLHYINSRKNLLKKKFKPEGEVLANLADSLLNKEYSLAKEAGLNNGSDDENNNTSKDDGGGTYPGNEEHPICGEGTREDGWPDYCFCGDTYKGRIINCYQTTYSGYAMRSSSPAYVSEYRRNEDNVFERNTALVYFQYPIASRIYIRGGVYGTIENGERLSASSGCIAEIGSHGCVEKIEEVPEKFWSANISSPSIADIALTEYSNSPNINMYAADDKYIYIPYNCVFGPLDDVLYPKRYINSMIARSGGTEELGGLISNGISKEKILEDMKSFSLYNELQDIKMTSPASSDSFVDSLKGDDGFYQIKGNKNGKFEGEDEYSDYK